MHSVNRRSSDLGKSFRRLMRHLYVERQIYIRSHGRVQFISLSPFTQAIFAGIGFAFFSWVAFTSVNVVFKTQIIASKEDRLQKMQSTYEERLAQLQTAYDELNGQLVLSQERFLASTRDLEEKHQRLTTLISHSKSASSELARMRARNFALLQRAQGDSRSNSVLMSVDQDADSSSEDAGANLASTTTKPQQTADAAAFVIDGAENGNLDISGLAGNSLPNQTGMASQIDARLSKLNQEQQSLANAVEESTDQQIRKLRSVIAMTDVGNAKNFKARKASSGEAEGGPFMDLAEGEALAGGGGDNGFSKQVFRISQNLNTLGDLEDFIAKMPLAEPLTSYEETSGFGPRKDPFNGRRAFHPGLDLSTSYGAPIYSTSDGTVVYAGWQGAYGQMVEIDLGNGFRVRYGHMSAVGVKVGQRIAFRDVIGRVGSTGRSSGPHLHYEVWFGGMVRDPSKFIEAGHYVFTKQG